MNASVLPADTFCSLAPQQTRSQAALLIQQLYGCQSFPSYFTASHPHKGAPGRVFTTNREERGRDRFSTQQKQANLFPPGSCHVAQGLGRGCRELAHLLLCERVNRKCPDLCNKMAHSPLGGGRMIRILSTPRPNGPAEGRLNKVLHVGRGT